MHSSNWITSGLLGLLLLTPSCKDDESKANPNIVVDGSSGNGGAATGDDSVDDAAEEGGAGGGQGAENDQDCFEHPTTHYEIINACTDAVKVEKHPELIGLTDEGELPSP